VAVLAKTIGTAATIDYRRQQMATTTITAAAAAAAAAAPTTTTAVDTMSTTAATHEFDRRILLTGAAGFIGSAVALHLVRTYPRYLIVGYDALTYAGNMRNLDEIADAGNFRFVKGDIRSQCLLSHVLRQYEIDTILHFAACTHVDNSFGSNSIEFTQTNVVGTHVVLECALQLHRQQRLRMLLAVSSDEVYGGENDEACGEDCTVLAPSNPYAATKSAAEHLVRAYHKSFGLPVVVSRGNNVVGPRQFPEKLIPKFIHMLQQAIPCTIHGRGESRRSFLYVDDVARAFDVLLHRAVIGETYNIGSPREYTVMETYRRLVDLMQCQQTASYIHVRDRNFNDPRYLIDCRRMEALGWRATTSFDDALRLTIDWYRQHPHHFGSPNQLLSTVLVAHSSDAVDVGGSGVVDAVVADDKIAMDTKN
jgi:dTDP-glucose 4,6-dehydratase